MGAHALSLAPFLFVPLFPNISYMIFASAMFTLFYRAEAPALMEIIRRNLTKRERETSYSAATTAGYIEGIGLALFTGWMIEHLSSGWIFLFPTYALIGLCSLFFQARLEICPIEAPLLEEKPKFSFIEPILSGLELLKKKPGFFRFQIGYFFCGGGLMLAMPALPGFLTSHHFGFTALFASSCAMKEVGMILAAPLWGYGMKRIKYETLSAGVFVCVAAFLSLIHFLNYGVLVLCGAYFIYGIAQAGSHLIWNLSGPYFSKDSESSRYTMVNVFMVGLRGCLIPPIGGVISDLFGPSTAIFCAVILSLIGAIIVATKPKEQQLLLPEN